MRDKKIKYLWGVLYTACLMLFCAGSSPVTNGMGTDGSVFFTIGRGMASGKIPYLDFFDHKGWYLYFFNFLGACISDKTTWGVFAVECIFMSVNAILFYKITDLVLKKAVPESLKYISAAFLLLLTLNFFTYQGGNTVESYGLTFQLISILFVVKYYKGKETEHPPLYMMIHGVCAGVMLGLRVNMTAMWGAVGIVLLTVLLANKKYKNALLNIGAGFLGVCAGLLPMILYCLKTGSLWEMMQQSVFFNLIYTSQASAAEKILKMFTHYRSLAVILGCMTALAVVIRVGKYRRGFRSLYTAALIFSVISVSLSGRNYGHYYEYLIPFLIPAVLEAVKTGADCGKKYVCRGRADCPMVLLGGIFLLTVCTNFLTPARVLGGTNVQKTAEAADSMEEIYKREYADRKTMLTVNNKSVFYNKLNIMPENKFFYIPSVDFRVFPDAVNAQAESLLSGENDILIISYRDYGKKQIFPYGVKNKEILRYLEKNYEMVYEQDQIQMYVKRRNE